MSQAHAHAHEGEEAHAYEPELNAQQLSTVGIYAVVLSGALFATLMLLFMYFRYESEGELARKAAIESPALIQLRTEEQKALSTGGEAIDAAMAKTVADFGKAHGNAN